MLILFHSEVSTTSVAFTPVVGSRLIDSSKDSFLRFFCCFFQWCGLYGHIIVELCKTFRKHYYFTRDTHTDREPLQHNYKETVVSLQRHPQSLQLFFFSPFSHEKVLTNSFLAFLLLPNKSRMDCRDIQSAYQK